MTATLLTSKPIVGLTLSVLAEPSFQNPNHLQLLALLLAIKALLACVVTFFAALAIIIFLACALCAIVTRLSSDTPDERTVI